MKKAFIFLSAFLLCQVIMPKKAVSALINEKGTSWWTVEELLEFYPEVEAEKEAECGDNHDCKMEFSYSMFEKGPKYSALENLTQGQFWITSVNPAAETIKVLYFDEEIKLKQMGVEEIFHLEHLYIGWIEDWNGQIYNYDHERFTDGSMIGNHPMYDGSSAIDGADWLPAWEEVELSVAGSNLTDNTHGKIDFAIFAEDNMFNAQGHTDILSCLNDPDYQEGKECKMYISGDQWVSYFPSREETNEQTNQGNEEQIEGVEGSITNIEQNTSNNEVQENNSNLNATSKDIIEIPISNPVSKSIKAPETGKGIKESSNGVEISWWFILLNLLGIALIVWWFIPTEKEKLRKNLEKSQKKVLTKKADCDKMVSV